MKHILLPTDFSENSWNAIKYAIHLFKDEACTFHLLNTYTPIIYNFEYVLGTPGQDDLGDSIRKQSLEGLKNLEERITKTFGDNPRHNIKVLSRFDMLVSGIKEYISKNETDLIVMGTKGATGAKEVLFGSNTVHVFKHVKCPILAVPDEYNYERPLEILFPTDLLVDYNLFQIGILKDIAKANNSRLNALHVSTGNDLTFNQINNQLALEAHFKDSAYLYHEYAIMNVTEAIDQFQINSKINLLAMINNKHSFFENLFFKSTINQIGFHLKVPFLVIPSNT